MNPTDDDTPAISAGEAFAKLKTRVIEYIENRIQEMETTIKEIEEEEEEAEDE